MSIKMPNLDKVKIHNPIPFESLAAECQKAASILEHFIKGTNKVDATLIPPKIIENAKGVAVVTVIKAGFVWTGKIGSGLVVARLPNGSWSAPSSIALTGVGFGAQVGAQLTDFVFILNTADAVKAFSHGGNVTLGAQVGIAAGPVGRAVEASGAVINVAPIYTYAKNKGLFAGLSLEGSIIVTRNDANAHFYHRKVTPRELLSGEIEPPAIADPLYRALNVRFGGTVNVSTPTFAEPPFAHSASTAGSGTAYETNSFKYSTLPKSYGSSNTTADPPVDRATGPRLPSRTNTAGATTAIALYDFSGERPTDLSFKKGDIITIIKRTESTNDWWKGRVGSREGDFPANYAKLS